MNDYPKTETVPEYPKGDWISEEEWSEKGIGEILRYAAEQPGLDPYDLEDGIYAIYGVDEFSAERLVPLRYEAEEDEYATYAGVIDSNPGRTQRQTEFQHSFTPEELEKELNQAVQEARLVELDQRHVETLEQSFGVEQGKSTERLKAVAAAATGFLTW